MALWPRHPAAASARTGRRDRRDRRDQALSPAAAARAARGRWEDVSAVMGGFLVGRKTRGGQRGRRTGRKRLRPFAFRTSSRFPGGAAVDSFHPDPPVIVLGLEMGG